MIFVENCYIVFLSHDVTKPNFSQTVVVDSCLMSNVSIVIKREKYFNFGKSNGQSLVTLICYLFRSKQYWLRGKSHHVIFM